MVQDDLQKLKDIIWGGIDEALKTPDNAAKRSLLSIRMEGD